MSILTSETAQHIYGFILMLVAIGAIVFSTVGAWENYNKDYTYYENTFRDNFDKEFNKPDYSFSEDGNSFKVGVA
jgi:hypothetical protein